MASYVTLLSFWLILLAGFFSSASPLGSRKSLNNPKSLKARGPLSNADFSSDWPTNVVMVGGSQTYGLWVPEDGTWYDLGTIQCLGVPADDEGPCNGITIDQIGVVAGDGPCSFIGSDGFVQTIEGGSDEGYYTVGPPQTIASAKCGS